MPPQPQDGPPPQGDTCGVYCNNLSWTVGAEELQNFFSAAGFQVMDGKVAYFPDGRSKVRAALCCVAALCSHALRALQGWGIVQMATPQDATNAVAQLNNQDHEGRPMYLREV
jgi:hypothetical protein